MWQDDRAEVVLRHRVARSPFSAKLPGRTRDSENLRPHKSRRKERAPLFLILRPCFPSPRCAPSRRSLIARAWVLRTEKTECYRNQGRPEGRGEKHRVEGINRGRNLARFTRKERVLIQFDRREIRILYERRNCTKVVCNRDVSRMYVENCVFMRSILFVTFLNRLLFLQKAFYDYAFYFTKFPRFLSWLACFGRMWICKTDIFILQIVSSSTSFPYEIIFFCENISQYNGIYLFNEQQFIEYTWIVNFNISVYTITKKNLLVVKRIIYLKNGIGLIFENSYNKYISWNCSRISH